MIVCCPKMMNIIKIPMVHTMGLNHICTVMMKVFLTCFIKK
ncbi:hypothetical protein RDI58_022441 [Solanum bulbocastanum]|uniref:Uncharacterized protein n=1 Tax=Solanum bulbocastanum TaxID=147425 RepID=A0AAN8T7Z6_SOLBU